MQVLPLLVAASLGLFWNSTDHDPKATGKPAIETRALSIKDERFREIVKVGESFQPNPAMIVKVQFRGAELGNITHWSGLKLAKAADDLGNDLRLEDDFMQTPRGDKPTAIDRKSMFFMRDEKPTDELLLELRLKPAPRKATKLEGVTGTIDLYQATVDTLRLEGLAKLKGKTVDRGKFKKAGVTVTVKDVTESEVVLDLKGKHEAISNWRLINASGEDKSSGSMTGGFLGQHEVRLYAESDARNLTVLCDVATEMTKRTVEIALPAIELP